MNLSNDFGSVSQSNVNSNLIYDLKIGNNFSIPKKFEEINNFFRRFFALKISFHILNINFFCKHL